MPKSRWVFPSCVPIFLGLVGPVRGKIHGTFYYYGYFFNRSQAVLLVGKMGVEAMDGCKKIC